MASFMNVALAIDTYRNRIDSANAKIQEDNDEHENPKIDEALLSLTTYLQRFSSVVDDIMNASAAMACSTPYIQHSQVSTWLKLLDMTCEAPAQKIIVSPYSSTPRA